MALPSRGRPSGGRAGRIVGLLKIRPGVGSDAADVAALIASFNAELMDEPTGAGAEQYLASVSEDAERVYLESERYRYLLAFEGAALAGFIALRDSSHIFHLFVSRPHQRRGLARHLWHRARDDAMFDVAPRVFTVNSSINAVPVYQAFGFVSAGSVAKVHGISFRPMRLQAQVP